MGGEQAAEGGQKKMYSTVGLICVWLRLCLGGGGDFTFFFHGGVTRCGTFFFFSCHHTFIFLLQLISDETFAIIKSSK